MTALLPIATACTTNAGYVIRHGALSTPPLVGYSACTMSYAQATASFAIGSDIYIGLGFSTAQINMHLLTNITSTINWEVVDQNQTTIIPMTSTTGWVANVVNFSSNTMYFLHLKPTVIVAVGGLLAQLASASLIGLSNIMDVTKFVGPVPLQSGESFTITATGATIVLNRALVKDQPILLFTGGPTFMSGSFNVSSSVPTTIPSVNGTFSVGQSIGVYVMPAKTGTFSLTMTVSFSNIGQMITYDTVLLDGAFYPVGLY